MPCCTSPAKASAACFRLRKEDGLKLYSRNILIDEYNKDLLPEYLRFVQGVVDSEDLPLNVSRETVQSTGLMARLKKVLTNQVIKELETLAKNDAEKYQTFWKEFGGYLKQGVATSPAEAEMHHAAAALQDQSAARNLVLAGGLRRAHASRSRRTFISSSATIRSPSCAARTWITSRRRARKCCC